MDILLDKINIVLLIIALLNLWLGGLIFLKGPKKRINITYSAICVALIAWIFGMIFYRSASQETALFWCTILYIAPTFIPSIFLYFTYIFPHQEQKSLWLRSLLIFSSNAVMVVMVAWPDFIIKEVNIRPGLEKEIIFTQYYWLYFIYISFLFTFGFYRLFIKYRKSAGIEKQQILYLFLGDALSANSAFVTNLIMPWIGYFFLNWLGQVFTITMVGFASYAIIRYRLMDIRIVARKIYIYFGIATFTYGMFYLIAWIYQNKLGSVFSTTGYLVGLIIAPLFVIVFYSVERLLKITANKFFFVSLYNYQETINKLTDELNYYIDLDKIISLIVDTIKKTMQLDRAGVLLINQQVNPSSAKASAGRPVHYQIAKVIGFNRQNGISLVQDNFLTKHLHKTQKPLVRDELNLLVRDARTNQERKSFEKLNEHMKHIEASLCLPLLSSKKLIGIIVLGAKISGDAYTKEDLELLNTMAKQAGIAIENAMLYKQVQDFSKNLQQKVDEQTKYLKELLEMKSDFLRVVNHQLNTPLSVMKGYFSMMEEGSYPTEKAMPSIKAGLERINSTVADFWNAYELEGERMKMDQQKTDITEIVDRLIPEKQKMKATEEKKLTVGVAKPDFKVPLVWCDYKKIAHVVSNLLDNGIHYTRKGSVILSYELAGDDFLKINVKDTGVGIFGEDKKKIFKKFSRGDKATDLRPDGSGLGLFIAKKIVEGNGGEMTYYSEGENKGTTFSFTLPIYKDQQIETGKEKAISRKKIVMFKK